MYNIAIVGAKNSGKTTLVVKLLQSLSEQGVNCMSKKHTSHHHGFDTIGKDSERHRKSGAKLTIATNPGEFAIFSEQNDTLQSKIIETVSSEFDICLTEGDKFSSVDKILLTHNISEIDSSTIKHIIASYGENGTKLTENHFETDSIEKLSLFIISQYNNQRTAKELQND